MNSLISVIIPVYNAGEYLSATLDSVLGQEYPNIEIIVVDDCSTDNSCEIIMSYCRKYPQCQLIRLDRNGGQSRARNKGIEKANGEFIYFMDSDDILPQSSLSKLMEAMTDNTDITIGDVLTIGIENQQLYSIKCTKPCLLSCNEEIISAHQKGAWNVAPWAKLYRTSFLKRNNIHFKEGIILEDELWNVTCVYYANSIVVIDDIVYHYYIRNNSTMTQQLSVKHLNGMKGDIEGLIELFNGDYSTPLVTSIVILAFRLAESATDKIFTEVERSLYYNFLSKTITLVIIFNCMKRGYKMTIKSLMFVLPQCLWGMYLKLVRK